MPKIGDYVRATLDFKAADFGCPSLCILGTVTTLDETTLTLDGVHVIVRKYASFEIFPNVVSFSKGRN